MYYLYVYSNGYMLVSYNPYKVYSATTQDDRKNALQRITLPTNNIKDYPEYFL